MALPVQAQNTTLEPISMGGSYISISSADLNSISMSGYGENPLGNSTMFHWSPTTGLNELTLGGVYAYTSILSANGEGVTEALPTAAGDMHAFHWSAANGITLLSLGGTDGRGHSISADGNSVAGTSLDAGGVQHAFHWSVGGTIQQLSLGGAWTSSARISADGNSVAGSSENALGQTQAYHWSLGGAIQQLSLGGTQGDVWSISGDGNSVIGTSRNAAGQTHGFHWSTTNSITQLSLGGTSGNVRGLSEDGNSVIGNSDNAAGQQHAYHWSVGGAIQQLSLGGTGGNVLSLSADGNSVIGTSRNAAGETHGFHWSVGGTVQQLSLGGTSGSVSGMSADGNSVIGTSRNAAGETHGFHWSTTRPITELSLGGTSGSVFSLSADGNSVIGTSQNTAGESHAYHWSTTGGITELSLGGTSGSPHAMSQDGQTVVGLSRDASNTPLLFYWTEDRGIKSFEQILDDANVDRTGWSLYTGSAAMLSSDGKVVIGKGDYNGDQMLYILTVGGLITPEEMARALSPLSSAQQQSQGGILSTTSQTLHVARNAYSVYFARPQEAQRPRTNSVAAATPAVLQNIAPAAGGDSDAQPFYSAGYTYTPPAGKKKAAYATGSIGIGHNDDFDNRAGSGSTGLLFQLSERTTIGAGLTASHGTQNTHLDGDSTVTAAGVSVLAAHEHPSGLRLYGTASVSALDVSADRHYMNGGSVDASRGETDGIGYGLAVMAGYELDSTGDTRVMPYGEIDVSHTRLDAYTEQGGGFAASVSDQNDTYVASRLGVEVSHQLTPDMLVRTRGAWGHRYSDDGTVSATTVLGTQALSADAGERDWAEAGLSASYRLGTQTTLNADLSGRIGKTGEPAVNLFAGLVWSWN